MRNRTRVFILVLFILIPYSKTLLAAYLPESFSGIVKERTRVVVNISAIQVFKERVMPFVPIPDEYKKYFEGMPEREIKKPTLGSGFIISGDGYILTNNHMIENAQAVKVRLWDDTEYDAKVVGKDAKMDIALLKIDAAGRVLPSAILGDSDSLEVGDWVIAIGNPYGLGHTVTAGIVSAKGRVIGAGPYDDFIQTDAAINPGNSGGPLFNMKGEVVGINTAIIQTAHGIGFAIPINMAKEIIPSLKEKGFVERGWLGVSVQPLTPELARDFNLKDRRGAIVTNIVKDSPADKAGLKRGDVIVEFQGKKINDAYDLPRMVANTTVGTVVEFKVIRDGQPVTVMAKVALLRQGSETEEVLIAKRLGIGIKTVPAEIARQLGIKDGGAVLVTSVDEESPAWKGGILKGDIIIEVNRVRINSVEELEKVIGGLSPGENILIFLKRQDEFYYASVKAGG